MTEAPKKRWYVVQAFSGFEGRVAQSLREHIKLHNMEELFGEVLVPTEEVVEMRGGQRRKSERKFFPGYVLVQMVMEDRSWHLVRSIPRVMGFIGGTSDRPAPISDKEADAILIIGANPRYEAPLVNTRIRKMVVSKNIPVALIGDEVDLTYDYKYLGSSSSLIEELAAVKGEFSEILKICWSYVENFFPLCFKWY